MSAHTQSSVRVQVNAQGRISIPAKMRQEFHLKPGSTVVLQVEEGGIRITPLNSAIARAQALVAKHCVGRDLVAELLQERREEVETEEQAEKGET